MFDIKKLIAMSLALILSAACVGCAKTPSGQTDPTDKPLNPSRVSYLNEIGTAAPLAVYTSTDKIAIAPTLSTEMMTANNLFAAAMLNAMEDDWTGVFSPVSVQIALEILANGGDEATAQKLLDAVCPGMTRADVNMNAARLIAIISGSNGVTLNNAVVVNNAYRISERFAHTAADYYTASVGALDFSDPNSAMKQINDWISGNTDGLIEKMVSDLGADTAIVILNALTLDLKWENQFHALRELIEFKGTKGMQSVGSIAASGTYSFGSFDEGEMVILPYSGGEYAMAVILPSEGYTPRSAAGALMGRVSSCTPSSMIIKLPKLDLSTKLDILSMRDKLGLAPALDGAVYTNLTSDGTVSVSRIEQQSVLSLSEIGTRAASATAVVGTRGGAALTGDREFICNRPFAMVIYHVDTGTVMYISLVNNIG